jgi:methylmalonyl-CoA/ethylmalonyl-CoA epimerase
MNNGEAQFPQPPGRVRLHHIGFVVASIEQCGASFARSLGATWDGKVVFDPVQGVRVTFLQGANAADSLIELVEPGGSESPVSRFLEDGGGLHHLCYEVEDLKTHLAFCKSVGTIVIRKPIPAVAFDGRLIAWAVTKKRLLVEYLEAESVRDRAESRFPQFCSPLAASTEQK